MGQLKDVLEESGVSPDLTQSLDELINMSDEDIMEWLEEVGIDADVFGMDGGEFDPNSADWDFLF